MLRSKLAADTVLIFKIGKDKTFEIMLHQGQLYYSRLLISSPRVINRTDVEVPYLGG